VLACPPSTLYRFRKFARRNRILITTIAAVLVLCLTSGILIAVSALYAWRSAISAETERQRTSLALQRATDAEMAALQRLSESKMAFARSGTTSRRTGQQVEAWTAVADATNLARQLGRLDEDKLELRRLAVASLAVPDIQLGAVVETMKFTEQFTSASPDFRRLATIDLTDQPKVVIRNLETGGSQNFPLGPPNRTSFLSFDDTGRYLASTSVQGAVLWDLDKRRQILELKKSAWDKASFDRQAQRAAFVEDGLGVGIYRLPSAKREALLGDSKTVYAAIHPSGTQLAIGRGPEGYVDLVQIDGEQTARSLKLPRKGRLGGMAWSPDGQRLAVSQWNQVCVFDPRSSTFSEFFPGHDSKITYLHFCPADRNLLITGSWDGTVKLSSIATGDCWLTVNARTPQFSEDGELLLLHRGDKVHLADFYTAGACRWLCGQECFAAAISDDGNWLAGGFADGLRIWSLKPLQLVSHVDMDRVHDVDFDSRTGRLLSSQDRGVFAWELPKPDSEGWMAIDPEAAELFDPRLELPIRQLDLSADGMTIVADRHHVPIARLIRRNTGADGMREFGRRRQLYVAVSRDGKYFAVGTSFEKTVAVWNARSGNPACELQTAGWSLPLFHPLGDRLFTCSRAAVKSWDTRAWKLQFQLPATVSSGTTVIAFSQNSNLAAAFLENGLIRLIDSDNGNEICTLTSPSNISYVGSLCFSPDDRFLAVSCGARGLCIWDLQTIRSRLREIGLDWDLSIRPLEPVGTASDQAEQDHQD
jgi:WD40 repeat protein